MNEPVPPPPRTGSLFGWLALLYVASGLPFGIVTGSVPILYKDAKIDLGAIGLLALVQWPWTLKFLWAPALDRFGSRKAWAVGCQIAIAALLLALSQLPQDSVPAASWVVLFGIAFASATQDVAIDGHAVAAVPAALVGPFNPVRVTAYKIAFVLAGGFLAGRAATIGWSGVWLVAAGTFAVLAIATSRLPPPPSAPHPRGPVYEPVAALARRAGFWAFAVFVLLFKFGDYAMTSMAKPCLQDRGFSASDVGDYVTPIEIGFFILGAFAGGRFTKRYGVFRALWVLGAIQALSCLAFAFAANGGRAALWGAVGIEAFGNGLGIAPFLSLLMLACDREHAGAQYALLTAVMGLGRIIAGSLSGFGAKSLGYPIYFALTFAASLPAFLLVSRAKRWLENAPRGGNPENPS